MFSSNPNNAGRVVGTMEATPEQAVANELWIRAERSLVASAKVVNPAAGKLICQISGFQTWEQSDIYRLDYQAMYTGNAGTDMDIGLYVNGVLQFLLLVPAQIYIPDFGTYFIAPNSENVSLNAVAGNTNATYMGKLVLTRMQQGFRAG